MRSARRPSAWAPSPRPSRKDETTAPIARVDAPHRWEKRRNQRTSYASPVAPETKKSRTAAHSPRTLVTLEIPPRPWLETAAAPLFPRPPPVGRNSRGGARGLCDRMGVMRWARELLVLAQDRPDREKT